MAGSAGSVEPAGLAGLADCWTGSLLAHKPASWETWRLLFETLGCPFGSLGRHLGTLGTPFWWSRRPLGHPMGSLGDQIWIFIDFESILDPSWDNFWGHFGDFSGLGSPK